LQRLSIKSLRSILTLPLVLAGAMGCTFESRKCPDGYTCIPNDNGAGAPSTSGGNGNAAGSNPSGHAGKASNTGGTGAGPTGGTGGNVIPATPEGEWTNAIGDLAGTPSNCGTLGYVTTKPGENRLIVGIVRQGVFSSTDRGETWSPLGSGAGSDVFGAGLSQIQFDPDDGNVWWLSGTRFGSPFRTDDDGTTLKKLADFLQNDSISVDFSDPDRKTILVGGHEQVQEVEYSADGGTTWKNIGLNLPADSGHSSFPYVVDDSTFLVGTANNQVYRTTDKGASWTKVVDGGGGAQPLKHSNGSLFWAGRDTRGLVRSTDNGASWEVVTGGGVVFGMQPIELPDGRIAMRGPMGMLVTDDEGANWRQVTPPIPDDYFWYTTSYNVEDRAFYTSRFVCGDDVPVNDDALRRFPWDYSKD
jgi:photosystem II stability/assembly factor-like uncharacterized protein